MNKDKLTVGELVYKISGDMDNLKTELKKSEAELNKLKNAMEKTTETSEKTTKGFKTLGLAVTGFIAGFIVSRIKSIADQSLALATDRLEQETKLAQILRVSTNATDQQILSLKNQAEALEQVGVVGKDVITSAQAQLATFDLQAESIESLTPSLLNYLVAEKGANATRQDAQGLANGLAQALNGNFGALTRIGFVLDDTTKSMIENGTETERVTALSKVLDSTYAGLNERLAGSFLGTQIRVKRAFEDLKEDVGFALMPALKLLGEEFLGLTGEMTSGTERINILGREFFRIANILLVVGRSFKQLMSVAKIAFNGVQNTFLGGGVLILEGAKKVGQALGKNTDTIDGALVELTNSFDKNINQIGDAFDDIESNTESFNKAMSQALNPTDYQNITDATIEAFDAMKGSTTALGGASEDAGEKIEVFQQRMVGLIDSAKKAKVALEQDLANTFTKFGDSIKGNFEETIGSLAQLVVGAEDKIKELRERLSTTEDTDAQSQIKKEIKEQQEILKAREDFEERQASRIQAIKTKLEESGIDATKAGLDNLLTVRTLEEEIEEQRRIASLDEFTRFEEAQAKKLILLTDNLITEVSLTREKITKQEEYEAELTSYLLQQENARLSNTDQWAADTISKYKDVANELKSLLSLQSQIGNLRPITPIATPSIPSSVQSSAAGSSTTNNSTSINAPVTISGQQIQNLSATELSAILGFELKKFIR